MSKIIDGQALAEKIKDQITKEIASTAAVKDDLTTCRRPNLAIILVGERDDSKIYVSLKEQEARKVGIDTHLYQCDEDCTEQQVLDIINFLNVDDTIDAILLQLPLPKNLDTNKIISAIEPTKDVDRFHPDNQKQLSAVACSTDLLPPVFSVIKAMLADINYDLKNKSICIVANSDIFGDNLSKVLECEGGKVNDIRPDNPDLNKYTSQADVLITAIGKPNFFKKEMIKNEAVIIDVGITKLKGKIVGDVDFDDVETKCSYITPVPGGVGPLTIAMTFLNTLALCKQHKQ